MSAPKHIWSGEWEAESEAAAAARARATALDAPTAAAEAPGAAASPAVAAGLPRADRRRRRPRGRRRRPALPRRALGGVLAALVAAGAAIAVAFALGSGGAGGAAGGAGLAPQPFLGVQMQSLPGGAVLIAAVVPGSPADRAGLGSGDVIAAVDGHGVASPGDVEALLARMHPGERVRLRIQRGGAYLDVTVRLARAPTGIP
jgi:S1-C subfamily serine protease